MGCADLAFNFNSHSQALESENFAFRTQHLEKENAVLQEEAAGLRAQVSEVESLRFQETAFRILKPSFLIFSSSV